jgi:hypothetical protein
LAHKLVLASEGSITAAAQMTPPAQGVAAEHSLLLGFHSMPSGPAGVCTALSYWHTMHSNGGWALNAVLPGSFCASIEICQTGNHASHLKLAFFQQLALIRKIVNPLEKKEVCPAAS